MSKEFPQHRSESAPHGYRHEREDEDIAEQRRVLHERAGQLEATADELQVALDALALQAEAMLHRLRGGSLH